MDSHTKENSIRVLKKLRDVHRGQLDTSVIVEVQTVIAALEHEDGCSGDTSEEWRMRTLRVIAQVIQIVTDITDWMS